MAAAVEKLSSELAFKAHVDAINRDYVVEPHLGKALSGSHLAETLALLHNTGYM